MEPLDDFEVCGEQEYKLLCFNRKMSFHCSQLLQQATDKLHKFFQFDEENELRASVKNIPQNDDLMYWPDPYKSNWEPQVPHAHMLQRLPDHDSHL